MATATPQTLDATGLSPDTGQAAPIRAAIQHRWSLLADADVDDVSTLESLAAVIQSTYGFGMNRAAAQVQEWAAAQVLLRADVERVGAISLPIGREKTLAATSPWTWEAFDRWH